MLTLVRRPLESIRIGEDIEVIVCRIKSNQVWLGISAPIDISIHREEIYKAVKQNKKHSEKYLKKKE